MNVGLPFGDHYSCKAMEPKELFVDMGNWVRIALPAPGEKAQILPWVAAISIVFLVKVFVQKYFSRDLKKPRLPPGPTNWPFIGALLSMESNIVLCFGKLDRKFGPIIYLRLGAHSVMVISSVKGAEEVLKTKDAQFADRPNSTLLRSVSKHMMSGAQNISLANYDDRLKMIRKACASHFFTASKLANYEEVRRHEGAVMVENIRAQIETGDSTGIRINLRESLLNLTTNIMCTVFLGKRYSDATLSKTDEGRNIAKFIELSGELCPQLNLTDLFPSLEWLESMVPRRILGRYKEYNQLVQNCLGQIVEEHRQLRKSVEHYQDQDLVDLLLTLQESGTITEDAVVVCLTDMIGAGIDTNSISTEWAILELVKNPETLSKLQKEIDEVVGKGRRVEESDFPNLPYLQAVIRETFRLHPLLPLLIPRFNKSPATLGGYYVPANTTVFVNAYGISRHPLLWENPEKFNPDRFTGTTNSGMVSITGSNYNLMPFGSGRRMCLGYPLGLLLVQQSVSSLVHAFEWKPLRGLKAGDVNGEEEFSIVCHPKEPLCLSAIPRLAPSVYCTVR